MQTDKPYFLGKIRNITCLSSSEFAQRVVDLNSLLYLSISLPDNVSLCLNTVQSNLDSSNTDGSFTMANSNSFLSRFEILPIA